MFFLKFDVKNYFQLLVADICSILDLTKNHVKVFHNIFDLFLDHRLEMQCELADFTKSAEENNGYRYAFVPLMFFLAMIVRYL